MREILYDINSTDVPVAICLLVTSYRFKKQTTRPRRQNEQCTAGRVMRCREGAKVADDGFVLHAAFKCICVLVLFFLFCCKRRVHKLDC